MPRSALSHRPHRRGWPGLAFACAFILLTGTVAGCGGSPPGTPRPGAVSPIGSQPAASRSGAGPAWGAAIRLDPGQAIEDPASVSCPSAGFCAAVLGSGYAATYDGAGWSRPVRLSSSGEPDSVSCATASFCLAVDARDSSAFLFNGSTWSSAPGIDGPGPGSQPGMASVSCPAPRRCTAVDNGASAFTFDGTSWRPAVVIDPGSELSTVSCPGTRFCAAVDYGPDVVTFNGASWSKPSAIDPGGYLQAVSCASARFCVAVDRRGDALTFNGRTWSAPVNADPNGLTMGEGGISWPVVSCPSSRFCAVVDGAGGNVVTFDGSSWSAPVRVDARAAGSVNGPVLIFLMSVSCRSAAFCVAGDSTGDAFVGRG
jgi:hypothetical protein